MDAKPTTPEIPDHEKISGKISPDAVDEAPIIKPIGGLVDGNGNRSYLAVSPEKIMRVAQTIEAALVISKEAPPHELIALHFPRDELDAFVTYMRGVHTALEESQASVALLHKKHRGLISLKNKMEKIVPLLPQKSKTPVQLELPNIDTPQIITPAEDNDETLP